MHWSNYFHSLEKMYRIKIDNSLKHTIINHFADDLALYTEQDLYEQSRKVIQTYQYNKYRK